MKTGQFTPGQTHKVGQWDIYNIPQTTKQEALENIIDYMQKQQMESLHAVTSLMIVPGFRFLFTDRLFTNFHQPGSTLLLLVYALMGEKWKDMYQYALDHDFRFLSYGDSCLIIPQKSHV
jgi:S-adenosylmethionine:tRNA ribosyltransferase-isomerase